MGLLCELEGGPSDNGPGVIDFETYALFSSSQCGYLLWSYGSEVPQMIIQDNTTSAEPVQSHSISVAGRAYHREESRGLGLRNVTTRVNKKATLVLGWRTVSSLPLKTPLDSRADKRITQF